jgi:hypothetical protein
VRALHNAVERAVALAVHDHITVEDLRTRSSARAGPQPPRRKLERKAKSGSETPPKSVK